MNIEKMSMRLALEKMTEECPSCMVNVEQMENICASCADKMRNKGIKAVRVSAVLDALQDRNERITKRVTAKL